MVNLIFRISVTVLKYTRKITLNVPKKDFHMNLCFWKTLLIEKTNINYRTTHIVIPFLLKAIYR